MLIFGQHRSDRFFVRVHHAAPWLASRSFLEKSRRIFLVITSRTHAYTLTAEQRDAFKAGASRSIPPLTIADPSRQAIAGEQLKVRRRRTKLQCV